jgi:hypothetical protein
MASDDETNTENQQKSAATVLRGDDGKLYLLRKELLDACEVKEPEAIELCNKLLDSNPAPGGAAEPPEAPGAVQAFDIGTGAVAKSKQFVGPFEKFNPDFQAQSTVMCAGNMRWFDFAVSPQIDTI